MPLPAYKVTFDRIGRTHNPGPATFDNVTGPNDLAAKIYQYARRFLLSRDIEVDLDLEDMTGCITTGCRPAGKFTIERPVT